MPLHSAHVNELLDDLAEASTPAECLMCAYDVIEDMIDLLLKSIFHKDDYAVKFVVDPLLSSDGPLGQILVRIKLLLGLGSISKQTFDDIEVFVTLKEWVKVQEGNISFWDQDIVFELNRVSAIQATMPVEYSPELLENVPDEMRDMFFERHFQRIRSTIVLAVNQIQQELAKQNALNS
jgi:mannitol operon repressor